MTHMYRAVTKIGARFEQCCNSLQEGLNIHKKLIDNGWQIERYEVLELEDGPGVQMPTNLH